MAQGLNIGIIGGTGALGGAIARALLRKEFIAPGQLWISNRTGKTPSFKEWPDINFTRLNQELVDACSVVLLSVPPQSVSSIGIRAENKLVLSVMAGVSTDRIAQLTAAQRIVRAISSPAAEIAMAYSPWYAKDTLSGKDRAFVQNFFNACGISDEVANEDQIDHFTALTGPVPGFLAYYAECMVAYALKRGIDPAIADRAISQLFHAGGILLAKSKTPPSEQVQAIIDYAGTTAAGLEVMKASPLAQSIEQGLEAAYKKAKSIGE